MCIILAYTYIMTFLIFALSRNGARRNNVFNGFPFSYAYPTFIDDRLQTAYLCVFYNFLYLKHNQYKDYDLIWIVWYY
jgi:hypothetical protein